MRDVADICGTNSEMGCSPSTKWSITKSGAWRGVIQLELRTLAIFATHHKIHATVGSGTVKVAGYHCHQIALIKFERGCILEISLSCLRKIVASM